MIIFAIRLCVLFFIFVPYLLTHLQTAYTHFMLKPTITCTNMDDSKNHCIKWKTLDTKVYKLQEANSKRQTGILIEHRLNTDLSETRYRKRGLTTKAHKEIIWYDINVLKVDCTFLKTHKIAHLRRVKFTGSKLYLNKPNLKNLLF